LFVVAERGAFSAKRENGYLMLFGSSFYILHWTFYILHFTFLQDYRISRFQDFIVQSAESIEQSAKTAAYWLLPAADCQLFTGY